MNTPETRENARKRIHDLVESECHKCYVYTTERPIHNKGRADSRCFGCHVLVEMQQLGKHLTPNSEPKERSFDNRKDHVPYERFIEYFEQEFKHQAIALELKVSLRTVTNHKARWKQENNVVKREKQEMKAILFNYFERGFTYNEIQEEYKVSTKTITNYKRMWKVSKENV